MIITLGSFSHSTVFVTLSLLGFPVLPPLIDYIPDSLIIAVGSVAGSGNAELSPLKTVGTSDATVFRSEGCAEVPELEFNIDEI